MSNPKTLPFPLQQFTQKPPGALPGRWAGGIVMDAQCRIPMGRNHHPFSNHRGRRCKARFQVSGRPQFRHLFQRRQFDPCRFHSYFHKSSSTSQPGSSSSSSKSGGGRTFWTNPKTNPLRCFASPLLSPRAYSLYASSMETGRAQRETNNSSNSDFVSGNLAMTMERSQSGGWILARAPERHGHRS